MRKFIKSHLSYSIYLLALILFIINDVNGFRSTNNAIITQNGYIDLSSYDFNKQGNIPLSGSWKFYWNQFLNKEQLYSQRQEKYVPVPGAWNFYSPSYPDFGYATYSLHVKTNEEAGYQMGFYLRTIASAYDIYIDDRHIASAGKTSTSGKNELGALDIQKAVLFNIPSSEFDIIIHVSNFHYYKGGFFNQLYFGTGAGVQKQYLNYLFVSLFFLGSMLIAFARSVFNAVLNRERIYSLFFALVILFGLFRYNFHGSSLTQSIFGDANITIYYFVRNASTVWILFSVIAYYCYMFRFKNHRAYFNVSLWVSITSLFYMAVTHLKYRRLILIGNFLTVNVFALVLIIIIFAIAINGLMGKDKLMKISVTGLLILIAQFVAELLFMIKSTNYSSNVYSYFIVFFIGQMIIEAYYNRNEYEELVKTEIAFLQAQVKPSYLLQTMNTITCVSALDMDKARNMLISFSEMLMRQLDLKGINQFIPLKEDIELTEAYLKTQKEYYSDGINYNIELPDDANFNVPAFMLAPIVQFVLSSRLLTTPSLGRLDLAIVIKKDSDMLSFYISSLEDETLFNKSAEQARRLEASIGIRNLKKRFELLYKKKIAIIITRGPGGSKIMSWAIPTISSPEFENAE